MSSSQVERDYQDWILQMHGQYDKEVDHGEDEPVLVLTPSPAKGKKIGISSDGRDEEKKTSVAVFSRIKMERWRKSISFF